LLGIAENTLFIFFHRRHPDTAMALLVVNLDNLYRQPGLKLRQREHGLVFARIRAALLNVGKRGAG
jgi:hypothetical protein